MAKSDRKVVKFTTPAAPSIYPRLNEPDTKYKKEGEYSVKLRFAAGEFPADLLSKLEALRDEQQEATVADLKAKKQGAKIKSLSVRNVLTAETDKETGDETGFFTINCKMRASGVSKKTGKAWKRRPDIFDAKGIKLKNVPSIWGGSVLKVAGEAMAYYTPKDNEVGVAFYLDAVKIIKLVSGKSRDASDYGFGEEDEGYTSSSEFDDSEAEQTADADAEGGDGDGEGNGDDDDF
jgi:hypothetical protein